MLNALPEGIQTGSVDATDSGKRYIQAKLFLGMLGIDRERALTSMKTWGDIVSNFMLPN
jgi:hypothetical protein